MNTEKMYAIDGIAYAGKAAPMREAEAVQMMEDHILRVRFNDGAVLGHEKPLKTQCFQGFSVVIDGRY